jgi:hypothetical protein
MKGYQSFKKDRIKKILKLHKTKMKGVRSNSSKKAIKERIQHDND